MPTYDYLCESCGNRFDVWQKMTDDPITLCPKCAGHVHRVIHATGILFKGAGFYSTDSRGSSAAATSAPASEAPAAEASPVPAAAAPAASGQSTASSTASSSTTSSASSTPNKAAS